MRRLAAVTLLFAAQVHAAELQALILTGTTSEAAAAPLLEGAKQHATAAKEVLTLPVGFPKLVKSDTVPGLKPGFWIVLAGFCENTAVLDALKALDAGAYAKPVQVEAAACPTIADGWSATTDEAKDAGKRTLRGVLFDFQARESEWLLFVSLRDKTGALLAERVLRQSADSPCLYGGENELKAKGATLVLKSTDCMKPRGCPNPGAATISVTVSAPEQAINAESKVIKDPGYTGCRGE